ncbi:alpha-L-fucosidase [Mariniflexile sp. AS56]|uniref:alpha-L-fucosidase n=1 Tax=Mariniflexile sp. AS56 TaxID=3063957 RepID=UPI0026EE5707|nr:alpha-L-fucosidase [Mariniflexile sp. AS56]MDO7171663.1 alpha-L-fucosidase [Mariniflexile sp. AS56]
MIKTVFLRNFYSTLVLIGILVSNAVAQSPDKMEWWKDAKFGMFLHWGLYSQTAGYWDGHIAKGNEHFMIHEKISLEDYGKIANDFNPVNFDAEKWVLTAKEAGMKYIIITSKHHDGFAMFNSPSNDYNIKTRTPYAKDPMKELVDACHKHDMKFGFYYSLGRDWEDPDVATDWPFKGGRSNLVDYPDEDIKVYSRYFERKVKPQIKELLTQYGKIDVIWFDTPELISPEESKELRELILNIQPHCIINSRIKHGFGDYKVTEQEIVKGLEVEPWEACITMGKNWGYIEYDTIYKSSELMTRQLLEIVSKGGNLLLNNGPTGKGEITDLAQERLAEIGVWMKQNAEGIYGSSPWKIQSELLSKAKKTEIIQSEDGKNTLIDTAKDATSKEIIPEVQFTLKNNSIYAYVCSFHEKQVLIKSFALKSNLKIKDVTAVGTNKTVVWSQTKEGLKIEMPAYAENEIPISGFKIELQ